VQSRRSTPGLGGQLHHVRRRISRTFLLPVDLDSACALPVPPPRKLGARAMSQCDLRSTLRFESGTHESGVCATLWSDFACRQMPGAGGGPQQIMREKLGGVENISQNTPYPWWRSKLLLLAARAKTLRASSHLVCWGHNVDGITNLAL